MWRWISHWDCRNVSWQWLVTRRVAWASGLLNSGKQFHVLIESAMENWIRLRVLSCCIKMTSPRVSWLPATEFWLICFNKSFMLMWVYHLWQNEWLFWYQCLYKWDNINLKLYLILIFPDQTIMAQSGNGAASEGDVTSLGTGQELNFDDDTLKGKDSYNC